MSGTVVAQLLNLAAIPVLSRLFSPEDFGVFAVYFGISTILSSVSCMRYELAIMLPKKDNNAYQLVISGFFFLIITTVLAFILILFFSSAITDLLNVDKYRYLIFLVPVLMFLTGAYKVLNNWFSRFKNFKTISVSNVLKSAGSGLSKISFGLLFFKSFGLFLGEIIGQFLSVIYLFKKERKVAASNNFKIKREKLVSELKENKNFPFFSMPMALLNSVSVQILVYFLTIIYNTGIVGFYTQANKVMNYPLSLISNSFISVFYQKLTSTKQQVKLYLYSYLSSLAIAFVISVPVFFWGEELFGFVLGKEWKFSGYLAKLLIPLIVFGFATRNTSIVFSYLKLQQISLIWQILYLSAAFIVFFFLKDTKIEILIMWFSFIGGFMYLFLGVAGYFSLKRKMYGINKTI